MRAASKIATASVRLPAMGLSMKTGGFDFHRVPIRSKADYIPVRFSPKKWTGGSRMLKALRLFAGG